MLTKGKSPARVAPPEGPAGALRGRCGRVPFLSGYPAPAEQLPPCTAVLPSSLGLPCRSPLASRLASPIAFSPQSARRPAEELAWKTWCDVAWKWSPSWAARRCTLGEGRGPLETCPVSCKPFIPRTFIVWGSIVRGACRTGRRFLSPYVVCVLETSLPWPKCFFQCVLLVNFFSFNACFSLSSGDCFLPELYRGSQCLRGNNSKCYLKKTLFV